MHARTAPIVVRPLRRRRSAARLDMDLIPGPWRKGSLLLGNMMDLMRADFHRTVLDWANEYGGIYRWVRVSAVRQALAARGHWWHHSCGPHVHAGRACCG